MREWILALHEAIQDSGGSAFRASETLGDIAAYQGNARAAVKHYAAAAHAIRDALGAEESPHVPSGTLGAAALRQRRASALLDSGEAAAATQELKAVHRALGSIFGNNAPEVVGGRHMVMLSRALAAEGQVAEAERAIWQVLRVRKKLLGSESEQLAVPFSVLAEINMRQAMVNQETTMRITVISKQAQKSN